MAIWDSQAGLTIVGNNDPDLSPYLKVWIMNPATNVCVVGAIGEGTSREVSTNWQSPFEDDSLGAQVGKAAGLAQSATGFTAVSTLNTRQVWQGNAPHSFNIVMHFYALSSATAKKEVMDAIQALEEMAAPDVSAVVPGGRTPPELSINIGRNALVDGVIIKSMSTPLDTERTRDGYLIRATVNLNIESVEMLNLDRVKASFG